MAVGIFVTAWSTLDHVGTPLLAFGLGGGLLIVVGLLDDKYDLPWWLRICAQVTAALLMVFMAACRWSTWVRCSGWAMFRWAG